MEIHTPSPAASTNATPYTTAPSSPHRFPNFFYSAPTSPIHALVGFQQPHDDDDNNNNDFAFDFNQPPSISAADELFQGGKIKPLKPDPPKSPTFSPPRKKKNSTEAFNQTPCGQSKITQNQPKRGRETTINATRSRDKVSRSSSPFRISDILSDEDNNQKNSLTWYNKWNLKNLILFRSASEGSARRSKEPVNNKYSRITKGDDDVKSSSVTNVESCSSSRRVRRNLSAHEIHYTENRAVAEEMRRKTYLPYKSGLFGCLGFHNSGAGNVHQISRGITSVMKQA